MATDRVPVLGDLLEELGVPHCVLAGWEERGLDAVRGKRSEHGRRIVWPGPVVEREHDLLRLKEIVLFEVLEPEARPVSGVDLHHSRHSKHGGVTWTHR